MSSEKTKTFCDYLSESKIIKFPEKETTKQEYQKFVNEFFRLMKYYNLEYDKNLVNLFLNSTYKKNGGKQ